MNIFIIASFCLTTYLLKDNLQQINYNLSNFFTIGNLINYLYILIFHFYYQKYVILCIFITSFKLVLDIIVEHPMYQLDIPDNQNQIYIFGAIIWYLLFNFLRGLLNILSLII